MLVIPTYTVYVCPDHPDASVVGFTGINTRYACNWKEGTPGSPAFKFCQRTLEPHQVKR